MENENRLNTRKTTILYVITSLGLGGAEKLLLKYVSLLDHNKYSFNVICFREKPDDLIGELSEYAEVKNLKVKNKFNPLIVLYLYKLIRKIQPDIIHTHLFQPRIYTALVYLFYNRPILITQKHSIVNLKKHHIFILIEMVSNFLYDKIIAISQAVKLSLTKYEFIPSKKITVLHNSIDFSQFNRTITSKVVSSDKQIVIGTVGRIEREKGIKYLLLAMKIILSRYPEARLEIVGEGSKAEDLKKLSIKLKISNSVIFFGKFTDVIPFYNRMDIFVLPSLYEGFGIVLLEAMAAGVTVVATNVDGINEVIINGECGILVPPKNPQAIADAVIKIIEHPQLAKKMVNEGFKRAKLFDIREHIMKLDNLYTSLVGAES